MDDETAKAMKVIRLKDDRYGQYLTAGDDQDSVTLTKPETEGYNPKNTEWRLEWLNNSPKGLVGQVRLWSIYNKALSFNKDSVDYLLSDCFGALKQRSWPPPHGDNEDDFEWRIVLKGKNKDVVAAYLSKWSKRSRKHFNLCPSFEISAPMKNGHESNYLCHDKSLIDQDTNLSTIVNQKAPAPSDLQPRFLMQSPVCNKFTPPERQPCMHCNHGVRYNDIRHLHDQYMNMLPRWQVGQVFLQLSPTSTGFHASAGNKYGQYTNSGGNVNGSGVQKNGDVSLHSEINRSRDNNANFVNYEYE